MSNFVQVLFGVFCFTGSFYFILCSVKDLMLIKLKKGINSKSFNFFDNIKF